MRLVALEEGEDFGGEVGLGQRLPGKLRVAAMQGLGAAPEAAEGEEGARIRFDEGITEIGFGQPGLGLGGFGDGVSEELGAAVGDLEAGELEIFGGEVVGVEGGVGVVGH